MTIQVVNEAEKFVLQIAKEDLGLVFTGVVTEEGYIMEDIQGVREPYTYKALIQSIKANN